MRRLICTAVLGLIVSSNVGCLIPMYSAERPRRAKQLIYTADNLRVMLDEWERFWFLDQPDHSSPYRVHGGIL